MVCKDPMFVCMLMTGFSASGRPQGLFFTKRWLAIQLTLHGITSHPKIEIREPIGRFYHKFPTS